MASTDFLGSIGMGLQLAGAVGGVLSSYNASRAKKAGYQYQAGVLRNNAAIDDMRAKDSMERGDTAIASTTMKYGNLKGSQRARLAANGVDVNEGGALNLLDDTEYFKNLDAATLRDNANLEAWGFKTSAQFKRADAANLDNAADAENPLFSAFGTALTSGGTVASNWYRYKKGIG